MVNIDKTASRTAVTNVTVGRSTCWAHRPRRARPPTSATYLVRAAFGRFISPQQKRFSIAEQSKVVLSLAFGLARRFQAMYRNPVRETARLHLLPSRAIALTSEDVQASRWAQSTWRATVAAVRGSQASWVAPTHLSAG